jgi:hypothetical protein
VIIKELLQVLNPLVFAVKELSKNDANFISEKLGEIDFEIGIEMLVALRRHISEWRNKDMVSLMRFLHRSSISR